MTFDGIRNTRLFLFPFYISVPLPSWVDGALWLFLGFVAVNLLILMEVADRLSLKGELEIARDIQLAMLPGGSRSIGDATIAGATRPANTVGGDFYDVLERPDGRVVIVVGDVAGKGSPAALLMALLIAMLRTLVDENFEAARLVARLNAQVARHSPRSRFITLFYGVYDPRDGRLEYVNAGHLPPLVVRRGGRIDRLSTDGGGLALGMFEHATYATAETTLHPGDVLVLYTDGITEAENPSGKAFEEVGLEQVLKLHSDEDPQTLGRSILRTVETFAADARLGDDLTTLIVKRNMAIG
jgi:serine phosphatase RsbU (regulator of sigma subunit)